MSEWVSEWASERASEWIGGLLGEWLSDWVSECMRPWLSEWVSEWVREWVSVHEWVRVSEWVNEWVSEWVLARVCACIHDWVNEWLSEWDIDLVNQFFSHDMHRKMGDSHWKNVVQITKVQLTVIQPIKPRNVHGRTFCYWGHLKRQTLKLTLVQRFAFLLMKIDGSNQKFQFSFFPFRNHNTTV